MSVWEAASVSVLVVGFLAAAVADLRDREVTDHLWQGMGLLGVAFGVPTFANAPIGLVLWLVVGALALQHVFAWDELAGGRLGAYADAIEIGAYVLVGLVLLAAAARWGIGAAGVPWAVAAVYATVILARILFEIGALFGGADAKALIIAGVLVPVFAAPLFGGTGPIDLLGVLPFSIDLLTNAALLSLAVPIGLAVRNLTRGEFSLKDGFTGYSLAVPDLPHRYVWIDDARWGQDRKTDDAATTAEDQERRRAASEELLARGIHRVWVTPQIPFLVLMAAGAIAALVGGNLLLDLLRLV